jgi:hypothetical protein
MTITYIARDIPSSDIVDGQSGIGKREKATIFSGLACTHRPAQ